MIYGQGTMTMVSIGMTMVSASVFITRGFNLICSVMIKTAIYYIQISKRFICFRESMPYVCINLIRKRIRMKI